MKSAKTPQTVSAKKRRDSGDTVNKSTTDSNGENGSVVPLALPGAENKPKDKDEIVLLREQVDELQKQLVEKEEALRSAKSTVSEMNVVHSTVDGLKRQVAEKEALIKYANSQLHNAKVNCRLPATTLCFIYFFRGNCATLRLNEPKFPLCLKLICCLPF